MAEIKSTLDLVMERTRHLSMSEEEKAQQQKADFERRLQGLLQQYADGALTAEALRNRVSVLQAETKVSDRRIPIEAVLKRIDPDQDNRGWLILVQDFVPAAHSPVQEALTAYHKKKADLQKTGEQRMLAQLAQRHGIEGSAVLPNPQKDHQFLQHLSALRHEIQIRIEAIAQQIS
jgi:hypothetical protein